MLTIIPRYYSPLVKKILFDNFKKNILVNNYLLTDKSNSDKSNSDKSNSDKSNSEKSNSEKSNRDKSINKLPLIGATESHNKPLHDRCN